MRHRDDEKAPALAAKIVRSLQNIDPKLGVTVLARALLGATSFDNARDIVEALLEVEYSDDEIVALVERAAEENSQVSGLGWGRAQNRDRAVAHLKKLARMKKRR